MRAVALNYRDILVVEGHRTWRPAVPRVPASDGAGEVIAVGEGVTRFQVGDRVAGVFYPEWIDGPLEPSTMATLGMGGAKTDGMLSEVRAIHERGLVAIPEHL
ncbi:MAG: alcohol dehydrogenase catalytic domain-containing protein, partial [Verrucomicrobiota bacterium]|nr:alcohol dehydrogenase catalytic domain-containing protein [Verrucomicrobiota bacterium]